LFGFAVSSTTGSAVGPGPGGLSGALEQLQPLRADNNRQTPTRLKATLIRYHFLVASTRFSLIEFRHDAIADAAAINVEERVDAQLNCFDGTIGDRELTNVGMLGVECTGCRPVEAGA
jgi:hypothetical protein